MQIMLDSHPLLIFPQRPNARQLDFVTVSTGPGSTGRVINSTNPSALGHLLGLVGGRKLLMQAQRVQHLRAMPCPLRFVLVGASAVVAILAVVYTRHSSEEGKDKTTAASKKVKVARQLASPGLS